MHISLDSFRTFYYVAQYQSITKAAEILYNNQPNVTRTIKQLELALGCPLFVRSHKGVQLTPEGEVLLAHIAPAMEYIHSGEEAVRLRANLKDGAVRIAASEIALYHSFLPVIQEFRRRYPEIHLRIYNSTTPQAIHSLQEHLVDLALVNSPLSSHASVEAAELITYHDAAVCGTFFSPSPSAPLTLEQLASYPLVSMKKGTATFELYHSLFQKHGIHMTPSIEATSSSQILPLVRANLGIGFIPEHMAIQEVAAGGIRILPLQQSLPTRSICLLKRKDIPLSLAAQTLEQMLFEHARSAFPTAESEKAQPISSFESHFRV